MQRSSISQSQAFSSLLPLRSLRLRVSALSLCLPVLLFASILLLSPLARAQFIKPAQIDFKTILTPPPAPDSDQTKKEIETILAFQQSRTPQDEARAKSEVTMSPWIMSGVLGPSFNPDDLPLTTKFLTEI